MYMYGYPAYNTCCGNSGNNDGYGAGWWLWAIIIVIIIIFFLFPGNGFRGNQNFN